MPSLQIRLRVRWRGEPRTPVHDSPRASSATRNDDHGVTRCTTFGAGAAPRTGAAGCCRITSCAGVPRRARASRCTGTARCPHTSHDTLSALRSGRARWNGEASVIRVAAVSFEYLMVIPWVGRATTTHLTTSNPPLLITSRWNQSASADQAIAATAADQQPTCKCRRQEYANSAPRRFQGDYACLAAGSLRQRTWRSFHLSRGWPGRRMCDRQFTREVLRNRSHADDSGTMSLI